MRRAHNLAGGYWFLPAIQAILRGQVTLAAKGNGAAQRAVIEKVQAIEQEIATQVAAEAKDKATERPVSDIEAARLIGRLLKKVADASPANANPASPGPGIH